MSATRPASADGLALLRDLVRRPIDYGLDYRQASLKNVLEFAIQHPSCVRDGEASAIRKINRCLERSQQGKPNTNRIQQRIGLQLLEAKEGLAWLDLEHQLSVISTSWNVGRYSRLAKCLCALAAMCRYRHRLLPHAPPYASNAAAARLELLFQLKQRGWKAVQDHLGRRGLDWRANLAAHLRGTAEPC